MVHTTASIPPHNARTSLPQASVQEVAPGATAADVSHVTHVSDASFTLMRRLGLEAMPSHEPLHVSIDRLLVPDEALISRSARRLVKSIQQVGVLQRPSVVVRDERDIHDADASFEVIAGRRRVLAARMAGLLVLACEVYTSSTLPLSSLLTLIENTQRSAAWVQEVAALRHLLDEKVGLTPDDLATFGFDRVHLAERLNIAHLPTPLLACVLAGTMSRDVARKLIRLTRAQQERVAALAEAGEAVTAERVKEVLRVQIANGLHPLQATLSQSWHPLPPDRSSLAPKMHGADSPVAPAVKLDAGAGMDEVVTTSSVEATNGVTGVSPCEAGAGRPVMAGTAGGGRPGLEDLLQSLRCFQHSDDYHMAPRPVQTLTEVLAQQIGLALRTPSRSEQPSHEPCETHEA